MSHQAHDKAINGARSDAPPYLPMESVNRAFLLGTVKRVHIEHGPNGHYRAIISLAVEGIKAEQTLRVVAFNGFLGDIEGGSGLGALIYVEGALRRVWAAWPPGRRLQEYVAVEVRPPLGKLVILEPGDGGGDG